VERRQLGTGVHGEHGPVLGDHGRKRLVQGGGGFLVLPVGDGDHPACVVRHGLGALAGAPVPRVRLENLGRPLDVVL